VRKLGDDKRVASTLRRLHLHSGKPLQELCSLKVLC
jgi:hypothetical protein